MNWYKAILHVNTHQRGLHDITDQINAQIQAWDVSEGMLFLFIQHTSASLVINENYDRTARADMESFLEHIAPEGENWYVHTLEGKDDSPSHLRAMITHTSLTIPVDDGRMSLGTWQGVYLAEHRQRGYQRNVLIRILACE
jgi:secondary thiamine-phosphate synthase enzyme